MSANIMSLWPKLSLRPFAQPFLAHIDSGHEKLLLQNINQSYGISCTMPPAVSKIALCPNQSKVSIENPGNFHDDAISAL